MVALNKYNRLFSLFTVIAVSNVWTGVTAQNGGSGMSIN